MNLDFLWQNVVWVAAGLALSALGRLAQTRVRRHRLRRFFGPDALGEAGVVLTVPVSLPLNSDDFDPDAEVTTAHKVDRGGAIVRRPIYGELLHLHDFKAAEELFALLRDLGAKRMGLIADADSLDSWDETPCRVCLGSPFTNATLGELVRLAEDDGGAALDVTRPTRTLDSYRLRLRTPEQLTLGVDREHALGAIARLPHPTRPGAWVVGVWGCRARSTHATARYLHEHFSDVARFVERDRPLTALLAIRGREWDVVDLMYVATDRERLRHPSLLRIYDRAAERTAWT